MGIFAIQYVTDCYAFSFIKEWLVHLTNYHLIISTYSPVRWRIWQTTPCLCHSLHCTARQNEPSLPGQSPPYENMVQKLITESVERQSLHSWFCLTTYYIRLILLFRNVLCCTKNLTWEVSVSHSTELHMYIKSETKKQTCISELLIQFVPPLCWELHMRRNEKMVEGKDIYELNYPGWH